MTFRVSVTAVTLSTATLSLTAIQQPDPIRSSLDKARAAFDAEMPKHQQEVLDYFDKREQQARDQGNKKLVEELKSARQAFIDSGDIHSDAPLQLKRKGAEVQTALIQAYAHGGKEYFKQRQDKEVIDTERQLYTLLVKAKRATFVSDINPMKVVTIPEVGVERSPQMLKGVDYEHSLIVRPGVNKASEAVYKLDKRYSSIRGSATVVRPPGVTALGPHSPAIFEILGNGKSLWRTRPVAAFEEIQEFSLDVRQVDLLTLRVYCPGNNTHCHAHWLNSILIR